MRRTLILAAAIAFLTTFTQPAAPQDLASQIVGVWKAVSNSIQEVATGKRDYPFGKKPDGYVVYTKGGRVVSAIFGDNRSKPAGLLTDADRVALFNTLSAVSGTYKVEDTTLSVTYDGSWLQSWTGATHKRKIAIAGNTLTITSEPFRNMETGQQIFFELVLERVE